MTAPLTHDQADESRPMILTQVPDGSGGYRNEWRPAPAEKPKKRKSRPKPDPIEANPDHAAQSLKLLIEQRERLEAEKDNIADDIKDVNGEVKALGFNLKIFNRIIARRKADPMEFREEQEILEIYTTALGLE